MCTVVCRWAPAETYPVELLALRDELASRSFDHPGAWWPDQPGVIGGRDRTAGGTWCVSDVATGATALVLNNPDKRSADPGAPSRGVLPLQAIKWGAKWTEHVQVTGMAGFNLVLATPSELRWWRFDGSCLVEEKLEPGTYLFKPGGRITADSEIPFDTRLATGSAEDGDPDAPTDTVWAQWLPALHESGPQRDPTGLIVRIPIEADAYETVFGQFILTRPGWLRLDYLDTPADGTDRDWATTITTTSG
jgi:hypothetical protein